jgi:hypothetical protein
LSEPLMGMMDGTGTWPIRIAYSLPDCPMAEPNRLP